MKNITRKIFCSYILLFLGFFVSTETFAADFPKLKAKSKDIPVGFYRINNMNYEHNMYSAIKLKDGRVFIVGGSDLVNKKANIEIFNIKTLKFSKVSKPIYEHYFQYASTVFDDGKVLIMADNNKDGEDKVYYFETYDPKKNMFDDSIYSINGQCIGEIYKNSDGNGVVYCRAYTDDGDKGTKVYETFEGMYVYNYKKERFEWPLYPKDERYINRADITHAGYETENMHKDGTVYINFPERNMLLIMGVDIPEKIKNAKTLEEIYNSRELSHKDNMSKKAYIFVYEK